MKQHILSDLPLAIPLGKHSSVQPAMKHGGFSYGNEVHTQSTFLTTADIRSVCQTTDTTVEECSIVHASQVMREHIKTIHELSRSDAPLLVSGENGTGKDLCIKYIAHTIGAAQYPCAFVNCGTVSITLLEKILFGEGLGTEKNEDSGETLAAQHAIVFLNEIADLPCRAQDRLIQFLRMQTAQESSHPNRTRIIASTNTSGYTSPVERHFNPDLQKAFGSGHIILPPLRERREDILPLATHFLAKYKYLSRGFPCTLSRKAENALLEHSWPGNVRMLENTLIRSLVLQDCGHVLHTLLFQEEAAHAVQ